MVYWPSNSGLVWFTWKSFSEKGCWYNCVRLAVTVPFNNAAIAIYLFLGCKSTETSFRRKGVQKQPHCLRLPEGLNRLHGLGWELLLQNPFKLSSITVSKMPKMHIRL